MSEFFLCPDCQSEMIFDQKSEILGSFWDCLGCQKWTFTKSVKEGQWIIIKCEGTFKNGVSVIFECRGTIKECLRKWKLRSFE